MNANYGFKMEEFDLPVQSELEAEVNRTNRAYTKWVQKSLNRILGLRLAVDGIPGTQTRSAIRSFQQRYGLPVTGIPGPQIKNELAHLRRAWREQTRPLPGVENRELDFAESETAELLTKKLNFLSFLPHFAEQNGTDVVLTPSIMDPGIYDGPVKYKVSPDDAFQKSLIAVMKRSEFRNIRVALVDFTKDLKNPSLAVFNHKDQVFIASVAKIIPMLAAFQLRHDLRVALKQKKSKTLGELFDLVRDDWANTQKDTPGVNTKDFSSGISLRGNLVLWKGSKVWLREYKAPRLDQVFKDVPAGSPVVVEFKSTGEGYDKLKEIVKGFNTTLSRKAVADRILKAAEEKGDSNDIKNAKQGVEKARKEFNLYVGKMDALGFKERMGIMVGGDVPASNYATSTVVRDLGFLYIASTLLQSGLYDTNRKGGLWLGASYSRTAWRGPLAGGSAQSATAGSLAAFMALLVQDRLVSRAASAEMRKLLQKVPNLTNPGTGSWFWIGLRRLNNSGSLKTVLAKVGLANGADDYAFIERWVDAGGRRILLRYAAVGLRANNGSQLEKLILELDKCVLANNGLAPSQGGHP
jgi:hypothetical protein